MNKQQEIIKILKSVYKKYDWAIYDSRESSKHLRYYAVVDGFGGVNIFVGESFYVEVEGAVVDADVEDFAIELMKYVANKKLEQVKDKEFKNHSEKQKKYEYIINKYKPK